MPEEQRPQRPGSRRAPGKPGGAPEARGGAGPRRPSGRAGPQRPSGRAGQERPSGRKAYTRKCPECGVVVEFGVRKCPECDASIGRQRRAFRPKKGGCLKIVVILAIVLVVLVGAFLGLLFAAPGLVPAGIRDALRGLGLPVPEVTEKGDAEEGAAEEEAPEGTEVEKSEGESE